MLSLTNLSASFIGGVSGEDTYICTLWRANLLIARNGQPLMEIDNVSPLDFYKESLLAIERWIRRMD